MPDNNINTDNKKYKTIKNISLNTPSTTIGIIYNHLSTIPTRGTHYLTTIYIIDENNDTLCVRIFSQYKIYEDYFANGDIVILKNLNIRLTTNKGKDITGYIKVDGWVRIIKRCIEDKMIDDHYNNIEESPEDLKDNNLYLKLIENFENKFEKIHNSTSDNLLNGKLKKIENIQQNTFFDFKGLCISVGDKTEMIKFTIYSFIDGTQNTKVISNTDIEGYNAGKVLNVVFWNPKVARKIEKGKCYWLRNLRIREIGKQLSANFSENNNYDVIMIPKSHVNMLIDDILSNELNITSNK
ncbi:hypothetical protein CDIK_1905 [Cucumispora dikerogammari]|nr:hypothetical protein CDIK_1905 [Cucumispora dikerogammari]